MLAHILYIHLKPDTALLHTDFPPPSQQNCCAIIVTFKPDNGFMARLHNMLLLFSALAIIDNGSDDAFRRQLQNLKSPALTVIQNPYNLGLAKALNQGLGVAIAGQFAWCMTFDQDSLVDAALLEVYADIYQQAAKKPMMIGCNYWHETLNKPFLTVKTDAIYCERKTLITSGTLLSLQLPTLIGFFREDYFIDSIDHEYALRARQQGYRLVISTQVLMRHSIGNAETFQRFKWFRIPEHTALRKYYITRNSLTTAVQYCRQEPCWGLKQVARLVIESLTIVLYEPQKRAKLSAMCLGLWHALIGQMGELSPVPSTWRQHD